MNRNTTQLIAFVSVLFSLISGAYAVENYSVSKRTSYLNPDHTSDKYVRYDFQFALPQIYNPVFKVGEPLHLGFFDGISGKECAVYPQEHVELTSSFGDGTTFDAKIVGAKIKMDCTDHHYYVKVEPTQHIDQYKIVRAYQFRFMFHKTSDDAFLGEFTSDAIMVSPDR